MDQPLKCWSIKPIHCLNINKNKLLIKFKNKLLIQPIKRIKPQINNYEINERDAFSQKIAHWTTLC